MQQEKAQEFTKCMKLLTATFSGTSQEVKSAEQELRQNYKSYQSELQVIITSGSNSNQEEMNLKQAVACILRKIAFTLLINENSNKSDANSFKQYLKKIIWSDNIPLKVIKILSQGFIILSLSISGGEHYNKLSKDIGTRYKLGLTLKASYLLEQLLRDKHYVNRNQGLMSNMDKKAPLLEISSKKSIMKNVFPVSLESIQKKMNHVIGQIQNSDQEVILEDSNLVEFCQSWEIIGAILSELDFNQYYPVNHSQAQPIFNTFLIEIMRNTLMKNTTLNGIIEKMKHTDNVPKTQNNVLKNDVHLASRRFIVHFFKSVATSYKSYMNKSKNNGVYQLCQIGYQYLLAKYDQKITEPPLVSTVLRQYPPTDFQTELMYTLIKNTDFTKEEKYVGHAELLHSYFLSAYHDLIAFEFQNISHQPISNEKMWTDKERSLEEESFEIFERFEEVISDLILGNYMDKDNRPIEKSQELSHTHFYKLGYLLNMLVQNNQNKEKQFIKIAQLLLPLSKNPNDVQLEPYFQSLLSMASNEDQYTIKLGLFFAIHLAGLLQTSRQFLELMQQVISEWFPIYLDQIQQNNGFQTEQDRKEFFLFLIFYRKYADDMGGPMQNFRAPSELLTIIFKETNSMPIDLAILEFLTMYVRIHYDYAGIHKDNINNIVSALGEMLNNIDSLGIHSFDQMIQKISQVYMVTVMQYLEFLLLNQENMEEITLANIFETLSKNIDFIKINTYVQLLHSVIKKKPTKENMYLVAEKSLQCVMKCFDKAIQDKTIIHQLFHLINICIYFLKGGDLTKLFQKIQNEEDSQDGEKNEIYKNYQIQENKLIQQNVDEQYVFMIQMRIADKIKALMNEKNLHMQPEREVLFRFYRLIMKLKDTDEQQFEDAFVKMFDICLKYISEQSFNLFDNCFGQIRMNTLENLVRFFIILHWGTVNFPNLLKKEQIQGFMDTFDMYQNFKKTYKFQITEDNYKIFLLSKYKTQVLLLLLKVPNFVPLLSQREWKGEKKLQGYLSCLSNVIFSSANQYQLDYEMPMLLGEINTKFQLLLDNQELDPDTKKFMHLYLKISMNLLEKMKVRSTFRIADNYGWQIEQFNKGNDVSDDEDQEEDAKIKRSYVDFRERVMKIYRKMYDPNLDLRYGQSVNLTRSIIGDLRKHKGQWYSEVVHKFVHPTTQATVEPLLKKPKKSKKK